MSGIPSVAVVMSTYNGAAYVRAQLESVLRQDVVGRGLARLSVYVRDDGSSDGTLDVLAPYEADGRITLVRGANEGVVGSFFTLLEGLPDDVDYVALCDQDDVWHPDKLSRALEALAGRDQDVPQLYCSEYVFCDADMTPRGASRLNRTGVSFAKMLYENATSGNTMVMNSALLGALVGAGWEGVYCHDWWIALVATALGELTYDDHPCLDYRRTGSNASPTGTGALSILRYRLSKFLDRNELGKITTQLLRLRGAFGPELSPRRRAVLERFLDGGRLGKALAPLRLRQTIGAELALRALFLAGLL